MATTFLTIHANGKTFTYTRGEAAAAVRAEGQLFTGNYVSAEGRCVLGVLGHCEGTDSHTETDEQVGFTLIKVNDHFGGTPAGRAEYVARWIESYQMRI